MASRFKSHYIFPDEQDYEQAEKLAAILSNKTGEQFHLQPTPSTRPDVLSGDVIIGIGSGGALACKAQESLSDRDISVVAINTPLTPMINPVPRSSGRVALYSSLYPAMTELSGLLIASQTSQNYDIPWLMHGIKDCKHGLSFLLKAYLDHENIALEVLYLPSF